MNRFLLSLSALLILSFSFSEVSSLQGAREKDLLLIKNALILPLAKDREAPVFGFLLVDPDGKIKALSEGRPPPRTTAQTVLDVEGKIILPGFVSGHNHPWQSAWRGLQPNGELWPWLNALHFTYLRHFQKGDFHAFALHGDHDLLRHGITTWMDYSQRFSSDELYLEEYQADLEAGGHFVFSYVIDRNLSLPDGLAAARSFLTKVENAPPPKACLGVNLNSVGIHFGKDILKREAEIAKKLNLDIHFHFLEDAEGAEEQRTRFSWFEEFDLVGPRSVYAHFIHPDESIIEKTGEKGGAMIWNPLSNGRLASGLPDIPHYLEKGIRVGMGVDGQASADLSDPFENMRMGLYAIRMKYQKADILTPLDILRLHTLKTAQILHVDREVGSLEPGKFADFLIVNPDIPATGPLNDPYAAIVFACNASNIDSVYVAGRLKVRRGKLLGFDSPALNKEVRERVAAIKKRQAETRETYNPVP